MLNKFINYLNEQQFNPLSNFRFYISKIEDDRIHIDVFKSLYKDDLIQESFEYFKDIIITDDTINKFVTGYYDILFEEWFTINYL